jgi:hypothetical protein
MFINCLNIELKKYSREVHGIWGTKGYFRIEHE